MNAQTREHIAEHLGHKILQCQPLQGGCIGEVYRVDLDSGSSVVAKVDSSAQPTLTIEGDMLTYLRKHSALPVPTVLLNTPQLLLLEHLRGDSHFSDPAQKHAAELLATLHSNRAATFSLDWDTRIGALHQPNTQESDWLTFFREHRILHMTDLARQEGVMPTALHQRLHHFAENLDKFIEAPAHPALLHGDVWTTNVLAEGNQISGFIDPAIYYGHPEIELAFTTLFGTFGDTFFKRYHEISPISAGFFEIRKEIYNLYPLLVHVRLFGAGYLSGIERCISRHGY